MGINCEQPPPRPKRAVPLAARVSTPTVAETPARDETRPAVARQLHALVMQGLSYLRPRTTSSRDPTLSTRPLPQRPRSERAVQSIPSRHASARSRARGTTSPPLPCACRPRTSTRPSLVAADGGASSTQPPASKATHATVSRGLPFGVVPGSVAPLDIITTTRRRPRRAPRRTQRGATPRAVAPQRRPPSSTPTRAHGTTLRAIPTHFTESSLLCAA